MHSPFKKPKSKKGDINQQLSTTIYKKVTAENYQENQDETSKECKKLFKQGASPKTLAELEKILRERQNKQAIAKHLESSKPGASSEALAELEKSAQKNRKHYNNYTQHFLPALKAKITKSKKLNLTEKTEIEKIIMKLITLDAVSKNDNKDHSDSTMQNQNTTAGAVEVQSGANTSKLSSGSDLDSGIESPVSSGRSSLILVTSTSSEESLNSTLNSVEEDNGLQPEDEGETKLAHLTKTRAKGPSGRRSPSKHHEKKDPMQPEEKEEKAVSSKQEASKDILSKKQPNKRNLHVALVAGCALSTIGCIVAGAMTSGLIGAGLLAMAAVFAIAAVAELHSNFLSSKLTSINVSPLVDDKSLQHVRSGKN